jgi:hypothetical protein
MVSDRRDGGYRRVILAAVGYLIALLLCVSEGRSQQPLPAGLCAPDPHGVGVGCAAPLRLGEAAQPEHGPPVAKGGQAIQAEAERSAEAEEEPGSSPRWPASIEAGEKASQTECGTEEECRSEQRDYSDLRAQWKAANAAGGQERFALFQTIIAAVATIIAGIGTIFLIWTLRESRRAADAAVAAATAASEANKLNRAAFAADQRPWLSVTVEPEDRPIRWKKDGLGVYLVFYLTNVGKAPATNADIVTHILPKLINEDLAITQLLLSEEVKMKTNLFGETVFPGVKLECRRGIPVPRHRITNAFTIKDKNGQPLDLIMPCIVGCVDYESALDGRRYQTGFIWTIDRLKDGRVAFGIVEAEGDLLPEQILLQRWPRAPRVY